MPERPPADLGGQVAHPDPQSQPGEPAAPGFARCYRYLIRILMGVTVSPLRNTFWVSNVPRILLTPERTIRLPGRVSVNRTGKV